MGSMPCAYLRRLERMTCCCLCCPSAKTGAVMLLASGAQTAIWLDIHEIPKDAAWTADEYAHINALQSFVNDLIEQINHLEGFQGGAG